MDIILQIAERLRGLRDALELTTADMASQCDISEELLAEYESGMRDIPVSFIHRLSSTYGVEMSAIMFGNEPRMNSYYITRAGKGGESRTHRCIQLYGPRRRIPASSDGTIHGDCRAGSR